MKGIVLFLCIFAASEGFSTYLNVINEEWEAYKAKYDKTYDNTFEEGFRMKRYLENKLAVAKHNQMYYDDEVSYYLRINDLSDRLPHEIAARNGFRPNMKTEELRNKAATFIGPDDDVTLPSSFDWRPKGAVTEIKDQENCGSCWAFSATGSLEGQHFRKAGKLVSLSEQNLVDCVTTCDACNGGLPNLAFNYVLTNKGIDTEISYPYMGKIETCEFKKSNVGATDKGHVDIPAEDEKALMKAVATIGPISVGIDASLSTFHSYSGGVYYDPDCTTTELDHAVLVVGYNTTDKGEDYWIVKNSWGTDWGLEGYIYMARNKDNACGIATAASFPLV